MLSPTTDSAEATINFSAHRPRRWLSPSLRRALKIRVRALGAEQRAAADEIECIYVRQGEVLDEMVDRQAVLREMRAILFADAGGTQ